MPRSELRVYKCEVCGDSILIQVPPNVIQGPPHCQRCKRSMIWVEGQIVYVVTGVYGGCLNEVHVFSDLVKARQKRSALAKDYGLTSNDKPDNQHSQECRWNEENEVHLHPAHVQ